MIDPAQFLGDHAQSIVGTALLLAGSLGAAWVWRTRTLVRASAKWPSVVGTVVDSRPSLVAFGAVGEGTGQRKHTLVVEYTYVVDGKPYTNDVATFGLEPTASYDEVNADAARRLPRGARVQVFYDPSDPRTAALERGTQESFVVPTLLVSGALLASGWVWWRGLP